jgi:hypothetical protein
VSKKGSSLSQVQRTNWLQNVPKLMCGHDLLEIVWKKVGGYSRRESDLTE